jgi:hypothetical protein
LQRNKLAERVRSPVEFIQYAKAEAAAGRADLYDFYLAERDLAGFVQKARRTMDITAEIAAETAARQTPMQKLTRALVAACICGGAWTGMATEILRKQHRPNYTKEAFGAFIRAGMDGPRKTNPVLFIVGDSNTGKSFLLDPLKKIFPNHALKPAGKGGSYPLLSLLACDLALWNEVRGPCEAAGGLCHGSRRALPRSSLPWVPQSAASGFFATGPAERRPGVLCDGSC